MPPIRSSAADLIRALVKMYKENASTLTPDPLYSAFYDSHPPAPVRVAHLSTKIELNGRFSENEAITMISIVLALLARQQTHCRCRTRATAA